jgi:hypothetical protein
MCMYKFVTLAAFLSRCLCWEESLGDMISQKTNLDSEILFGLAAVCMGHWWMGKTQIQICANATWKSSINHEWHTCSVPQWPASLVGSAWISVGNLWCCQVGAPASCK